MTVLKKIGLGLCSILLIFTFAACEKEGPAERTGENIDEAVEEMREKMEEGAEEAREKFKDAGDRMKEATEN